MKSPRLISTYLPDGTLEGIRIIELSESLVKAFIIPRIKLNDARDRIELRQPSLYLLINSGENQVYIGESENCFDRVKNHDQSKSFWDIVVAVVSGTNSLEKSDVKYLESLAVERAKATSSMEVLNKTIPLRNNIHEFKLHTLSAFLEDTSLIVESLGYSLFSTSSDSGKDIWICQSKKSLAHAQFRGDKFIVLAGSIIDKSFAPSWGNAFPPALAEREDLLKKFGKDLGDKVELLENIPFRSPNHAGGFVAERSINAWITWKNKDGKTMDELVRKET